VGRIAEQIPPPRTEIETQIARHVLKVAAFQTICKRVHSGITGHAEAFCQLERIAAAIDQGPLDDLEARLTDSQHTCSSSIATAVRIRQFLSTNSTRSLTLLTIAKSVGCSVRTATTAFRVHYKITVFEYLTRLRLLHAIRLLRETDLKLAAVALLVGFRDKVSLHRHFLKRAYVTPMAIRNGSVNEQAINASLALPDAERQNGLAPISSS